MALILGRQLHLPAPRPAGREDVGAAPSEALVHQQRLRGASHVGVQQPDRTGLDLSQVLKIGDVRHCLPQLTVRLAVGAELGEQRLLAFGGQRDRKRRANEAGRIQVGKLRRQHLGHDAVRPTAVGEAPPPAEHEEAAAALADKVADPGLLILRQLRSGEAADDERIVGKQRVALLGEALGQLGLTLDPLAVELVGCRAQETGQADRRILLQRPADELVLPARLAFDVENAAPILRHLNRAELGVVDRVALPRDGIERKPQVLDAGVADIEIHPMGRHAGIVGKRHRLRNQDRVAVVDLELSLAGLGMADAHLSTDPRTGHRLERRADALQLDVLRHGFAPHARRCESGRRNRRSPPAAQHQAYRSCPPRR